MDDEEALRQAIAMSEADAQEMQMIEDLLQQTRIAQPECLWFEKPSYTPKKKIPPIRPTSR
jgi:hypothetical protein